jgi:hypothetical protein
MTTLLAVYNSEGLVGRCDAKCYEAIHPECECICGGHNHGKGKEQAVLNTAKLADQWLEECQSRQPEAPSLTSKLGSECLYQSIWDLLYTASEPDALTNQQPAHMGEWGSEQKGSSAR